MQIVAVCLFQSPRIVGKHALDECLHPLRPLLNARVLGAGPEEAFAVWTVVARQLQMCQRSPLSHDHVCFPGGCCRRRASWGRCCRRKPRNLLAMLRSDGDVDRLKENFQDPIRCFSKVCMSFSTVSEVFQKPCADAAGVIAVGLLGRWPPNSTPRR